MTTLTQIREEQGLSIRALAELAGVAHPTVSHMEHGYRPPKSDACERVARALGVPRERLFPDDN